MHIKTSPMVDSASNNLSYVFESLLGEHRIYARIDGSPVGYWGYMGKVSDLLDAYRVLQLFVRNDSETHKLTSTFNN